MPILPDTQDEIYEDLEDRIKGRTEKLTNFEPGGLNHTLAYHGFAGYFSYYEHALLAAQFSGWIDTAGGPIHEEDLIQRGIDPTRIDLALLNDYLDDADLDAKALENGVRRDPGDRAEGEVVFLTGDEDVVVPAGTRVATEVGVFDEIRRVYYTTEEVTPDPGTTGATAPIEAEEIGEEYNVGPGAISEIPSPPPGVRDVTNQQSVVGGEPPETNDELRERAKEAITLNSGGGTTAGIIGGIVSLVEGVDADGVHIEQHYDPPDRSAYVDVTVDGGDTQEVEAAIDELHPTAIEHFLNRPTSYRVDLSLVLEGSPIDVDHVESELSRFIAELGLGDNVNRAGLIQVIMNADRDISNIVEMEIRTDRTDVVEGDLELEPDERADVGSITVDI